MTREIPAPEPPFGEAFAATLAARRAVFAAAAPAGWVERIAAVLQGGADAQYNRFSTATHAVWRDLLLAGTERGPIEGGGAGGAAENPLHHPSGGPPPRSGEGPGRAFHAAHLVVMADAIGAFWREGGHARFPASAAEDFARWHARIISTDPAEPRYAKPGETLFKDLAAARGTHMPAETWLVVEAGLSRRFFVTGGPMQAARALAFQLRHGAGGRWLTAHLNDFETARFSEAGFRAMIVKAADLMAGDPGVRGMFLGANWLYDPALPRVSPRLGFQNRIALGAGASLFFVRRDDPTSGALSKSATRRAAAERGEYWPRCFLILWPRARLLAWAEREVQAAAFHSEISAASAAPSTGREHR